MPVDHYENFPVASVLLPKRLRRPIEAIYRFARGADDRVFEQVIEYFHDRFSESISLDTLNLKDLKVDPEKTFEKSLESLADLRKMDISLRELSENFHVPKEFIVLERTLLLLMGLCTELDPVLNPITVIRPYVERFVLGDDGDWSTLLVETSKDLMMSVTALTKALFTAWSGKVMAGILTSTTARTRPRRARRSISPARSFRRKPSIW